MVALVRNTKGKESLREALELCSGFSNLKSTDKVLIKPNLVIGGRKSQKPYGVVTTKEMVAYLIELLKDFGVSDITVADGGVHLEELGLTTKRAASWAGIDEVVEKYGVKFVDLNEGPHKKLEMDGKKIEIAELAFETDFFINLPVLKTHQQTKVSLGMKGLKGLLSPSSKKMFHKSGLEHFISLLSSQVKVDLSIIDGTYGLENGPLGVNYHKMNLIICGKDPLEVDIVGASVIGIDPCSVNHIKEFCDRNGRSCDVSSVEIKGESIPSVSKKLEWVTFWTNELLDMYGIKGVICETPGKSNCSGCGMSIYVGMNNFFRENPKKEYSGVEICIGKEVIAKKDSKIVFLLGQCAIEANKDREDAIKVKGCPPKAKDIYETLKKHLGEG